MTTITLPRATVERALEALKYFRDTAICSADIDSANEVIPNLEAALAQQAEPVEPVAWVLDGTSVVEFDRQTHHDGPEWTPLYTAPPQQAEPVDTDCHTQGICQRSGYGIGKQTEPVEPAAWGVDWGRDGDRSCVSITKKRADGTMEIVAVEYGPDESAPPQRKPLTEEEIRLLARDTFLEAENIWNEDTHEDLTEFARAVERAHGITDPQVKDRLARHGIPKP